ncbi:unnamed protein product, partial [Didymodactylos carnosus]
QGNRNDQLDSPQGIYVDGSGSIYIADTNNHRIQKWSRGSSTGSGSRGSYYN